MTVQHRLWLMMELAGGKIYFITNDYNVTECYFSHVLQ